MLFYIYFNNFKLQNCGNTDWDCRVSPPGFDTWDPDVGYISPRLCAGTLSLLYPQPPGLHLCKILLFIKQMHNFFF